MFFDILAFFERFALFLTCKCKNKKLVELQKFYEAISLSYSKSQDNRLWPRPVAFETDTRPETIETETKTCKKKL